MPRKTRKIWNIPKLIVIYKPTKESAELALSACKMQYGSHWGPALRQDACMEYMPLNGCFMPCSYQSSS